MESFARTVACVSVFTNVLPLMVAVWRFRRLGRGQLALVGSLGVGLLVQVAAFVLGLAKLNNYFLFHLYIPLEFGMFLLVFRGEKLFFARRNLLWGIWLTLAAVSAVNAVRDNGWSQMPVVPFLLEGILLVLAGCLYFWQVFREMKIWRVETQSMFWVAVGIWVYFLGGMLIVVFDGYLQNVTESTYLLVWGIHSSLVILTGILFAIALQCNRLAQKS
jgi:hypothetical protein